MTEGKTIGSVNVLDLRKTTEEALAGVKKIDDINILLYSPATASYISRLNVGSINASIETPQDVEHRTVMGNLRLAPGSVQGEGGSAFVLVMGHLIVEVGSDGGSIEKSLEGLVVMGHVFCPESLASIVQPKVKQLMGRYVPYPDGATLIDGSLELNAGLLAGLERSTGYVVTGALHAIEDVSDELKRKVEYLQIHGSILCSAENADAIRSKLRGAKSQLTVIPAGYRLRQGDLELDAAALDSLTDAKLFCTGTVRFGEDATAEAIETGLAGLRSLALIVCPERLRDAVKAKLDLVEDRAIFYEGDLWLFDQEHTLHASRFEYSEGKATVLVSGGLRIEPDVAPSVLADRFLVVHNLGEIHCTPEQMGAIEARLGIHEGELRDSTPNEKEAFDIGNANVLAL